jgi:hypothetical protein
MADFFTVEELPFQFRNGGFDAEMQNAIGCLRRSLVQGANIHKSSTKSFL